MSKFLSREFIDELISKNEITSVISKYCTLTRRGNNYWACCPFHLEKTPSFSVKPDGQFYKCFGCGESGNVISFIMKMENVDFVKAIEILCENAGIEMPSLMDNSEMLEKKRLRDTSLNILNYACKFYQNNLNSEKASGYWEYIKKRGLNQEMLDKFKIGASLDYDSLVKYLKSKGFSYEEMVQAGVAGKNEFGNYYDFYGTRLIFPIFNGLNEVVGFSGRDISNNPEKAKYKNTPQTMLFNKSNLIYGYNFLRELKKKHSLDSIILVEGQMDVIACHQAGVTNAVGCLGTALTLNHAKDLSHLSNNIILCLDGDNAGATATYRALGILREANLDVSVVRLEGAKDPDEFIKKFGKEKFVDVLSNAMNYMEFILIDLAKKYDLNKNSEKNNYINECIKYLSKLSTASEQEIYLGVLKEIVNVPIDALRKTLTGEKQQVIPPKKEDAEIANNSFIDEAKILILSSLLYNKVSNFEDYKDVFIQQGELKDIYDYILENKRNNININVSSLYTEFDIEPKSMWDRIINYNFPEDSVFNKYFHDSTKRLRIALLKDKKQNMMKEISSCNSLDESFEMLSKIKDIDEMIKRLETLND